MSDNDLWQIAGAMQENFYPLLTKHFFGQTTVEEERLIDQYKSDYPQEYARLRKLFTEGDLQVKEFNSATGWQKVITKYAGRNAKQSRTISLYPFARVAAGVALLAGLLTGAYFFFIHSPITAHTTLSATGMETEKVLLADGSVVWLNDNAKLTYPDRFATDTRTVTLTGEAFFEVARDINAPFIIRTAEANITVLGTSFNVNAQTETTEVSVATGTVQVKSTTTAREVVVQAGSSARANKKEVTSFANSANFQAWKTGIFQFRRTPLHEVIADLNKFYVNKLQIASPMTVDCALTAGFDNAPLHEVVEVLRLTCQVSIEESRDGAYLIR